MKPSQRLTRDREKLEAFRDAYVALIGASTPVEVWPYRTYAAAGNEENWYLLRTAVAQTAGPAGSAYSKYGAIYRTQSGPWVNSGFHPVVNWEVSIKDSDQFTPLNVVTALDAAIATADSMLNEAMDRERGLIGLLASFLRIPANLREAVGGDAKTQKAATFVGVFSQLLIGVTTTWLSVLIPQLLQKLVQLIK
jgi:hypothetical protein